MKGWLIVLLIACVFGHLGLDIVCYAPLQGRIDQTIIETSAIYI